MAIPSLHAGGMERVMSEILDEFSKDETLELHLILYGITREIFYKIPENVKIHLPDFEFNNYYRTFYTLKTLYFLRKTIKKINPITILSFGELWNNFVLLASYGLKNPIFISDRCQPDKSLGKIHDFLRKILYPNAKGIIAQTQKAKDIYQKIYKNKNIQVIGNPIRTITPNHSIAKENVVLSVGRLINSKHHDELIKLFVKIKRSNWKLIIVGDDALNQSNKFKLQTLIEMLKVEESVILAGKQTDVESYYLKSKIFVLTSSSEGFPNVIGEAQSAGLPVVAFDCLAGPSDLIEDDMNGYLIPVFDYKNFQKKLEFLMNNENKIISMGNRGKESVKQFSKKLITDKFKNFILNR